MQYYLYLFKTSSNYTIKFYCLLDLSIPYHFKKEIKLKLIINSMNVSDKKRSTFLTDTLIQASIKKEVQKENFKYTKRDSLSKEEIQALCQEPNQEKELQPPQRQTKVK